MKEGRGISQNGKDVRMVYLESFRCQFIISTHSPFLLSIKDACIYDLDAESVQTRPWMELANVRLYYDLFKEHVDAFK